MKGFGRLLVIRNFEANEIRFLFIVICFIIAIGSYFQRKHKWDWMCLVGGMAFTVGADYFLILQNQHLTGVLIFWFAHICYGIRAMIALLRHHPRYQLLFKHLPIVISVFLGIAFILFNLGQVFIAAGIYAFLFGVNLLINVKARKQINNAPLILTGLTLFALCDVMVLLYNVPIYFRIIPWLMGVFPLIWVFYLPAQLLLAVSAMDFRENRSGEK